MNRILGALDSLSETVLGHKVSRPMKIGKANLYCRVCKKDYHVLKDEFTLKPKSYGTADILYSARAEKRNVLVCARCVCSNSLMLNNNGDALVIYDNDRMKFQADIQKCNFLTDELLLEDVKTMKEVTKYSAILDSKPTKVPQNEEEEVTAPKETQNELSA